MVTKANFNPTMKGGIWVELICQRPNTSKEAVHKGDWDDPTHIINFPKPKVSDRVEVTGQYPQDHNRPLTMLETNSFAIEPSMSR